MRFREEIRNQIAETVTTAVELDEGMRHFGTGGGTRTNQGPSAGRTIGT